MKFDSIEEKVIYEKLTAGRAAEPAGSERVSEPYEGVGIEALERLMEKVAGYIDALESTRENTSLRPLYSGRRGPAARIAVFFKRVIRKLMRWYVEPVCQQQTVFNNAVTPSIGCINETNNMLIHNVMRLSQEQENLQRSQRDTDEVQRSLCEKSDLYAERQDNFDTAFEDMKEQYVKQQVIFELSIQAERERTAKRIGELEDALNRRFMELENPMDKLKKLNLGVFEDKSEDPWEKDAWEIGTFAQCGEDMVIAFILRAMGISLNAATYVDLGANHAKKISNTYHFYKHGARGVLVEANPVLIPELRFYRSGDVVLNRCVSDKSGDTIDFYIMGTMFADGDGLSTTDRETALEFIKKNPNLKIHNIAGIETISFNDIVEKYMGSAPTILNIDIEGYEIGVLKSIDFVKNRPLVIIIETIPFTNPFVITERNREILELLTEAGYLEYAFTGVNSIFLDKAQLREKGRLGMK